MEDFTDLHVFGFGFGFSGWPDGFCAGGKYDLDGVDMDWEYPDIGESSQNYEELIVGLSKALKPRGKFLTAAAVGSPFKDRGLDAANAISNECLSCFDWINIMAYDADNGPGHSPYHFTENSIFYWTRRGVGKEKLVIGVPFYARPSWKLYRDLVAEDEENAFRDSSTGNGLDSYYNGIYTIREKTRLALNMTSGIMIWEINMDTLDKYSLHKVIDDAVSSRKRGEDLRDSIYLRIDGKEVEFAKDGLGRPFIDENSRALMPVRKPLEKMGAAVSYVDGVIKAEKENVSLEIPIGKADIIRTRRDSTGEEVKRDVISMDSKPVLKESRAYVPIRYLFEAMDCSVEWHEGSRTVIVNQI